ncbi:paraquat-inducible membrane protein A [Candidatus Pantoea edessiphila]|uniref:Paraquat-inducible membrane protein A n=1 Tax=Candidatus Pantoea edessiphila TaxID=2044610 RepID=A0A2P5SYW4_9GAMM|nr:PqiA/YebS family transporter subunit [Candidatus Pantoea edessiphila]MBK4775336.1 PqiA/YebS family transporter subunit [Pantoea sp. Edef]PPI87529.1 paraquat-inducible membrane protein A [Candidatus Pantoea edessiphila]
MLARKNVDYILCPKCDLLMELSCLLAGKQASCPRCCSILVSNWCEPYKRHNIYALSTLFLLILSNIFPFININFAGINNQLILNQIPNAIISDGYNILAAFFILVVQFIPICCILIIFLLVNPIKIPINVKLILGRTLFQINQWMMVEIFMGAMLISLIKLTNYGVIDLQPSFWPWCLFCFLQIRFFQCIDRQWLWQCIKPKPDLPQKPIIGKSGLSQGLRSCPCCNAILPLIKHKCTRCKIVAEARYKYSLQCTYALLLTSFIFYIPANIMPVMITEIFGLEYPSSILEGIILLWNESYYLIAILIFIFSIIVPILKILSIGWLCWSSSKKTKNVQAMYIVYKIIKFVGRWSMIDVFVILILSSLLRIKKLIQIYPTSGLLFFALVVIFTMMAEMNFDPRLIWDRTNKTQRNQ